MFTLKKTNIYKIKDYPADFVNEKVNENQDEDCGIMICNLGCVVKKYQTWRTQLPRVAPFYAVKANDDHGIVSTLATLGVGFDCASKNEIKQILDLKVSTEKIIFANPCKKISHLQYAANSNIHLMTFDNEEELYKIQKFFPDARIVLRIAPPEFESHYNFSKKFGASLNDTQKLLHCAKDLNLDVVGVSFHVGSGCMNAKAFSAAVIDARKVFDEARLLGITLELLDIGGGFPGTDTEQLTFDEICDELQSALDLYFPAIMPIKIIAEPGRYFACCTCTMAVKVIAKKKVPHTSDKEVQFMYYLNEGVYSALHVIKHDTVYTPCVSVLNIQPNQLNKVYMSTLWGPTCCPEDLVLDKIKLPELSIGDWLLFKNVGSYNQVRSSYFNNTDKTKTFYVIQEENWKELFPNEDVKNTTLIEAKDPMPADFAKQESIDWIELEY